MTLDTASNIVGRFGQALSTPPAGVARNQSLLPAMRDEIIEAFKIVVANSARQGVLTRELVDQLVCAMGYLPSFIPDTAAARINATAKLLRAQASVADEARQEYLAFTEHMIDVPLMEELNQYVASLGSSHART
jgi:hypothetical protein